MAGCAMCPYPCPTLFCFSLSDPLLTADGAPSWRIHMQAGQGACSAQFISRHFLGRPLSKCIHIYNLTTPGPISRSIAQEL